MTLAVLAVPAMATDWEGEANIGHAEDSAYWMKVKYNGNETTATISNTANTVTMNDGASETITLSSATTLASLAASMEAHTNSSGQAEWEVEILGGIGTDTPSNKLIAVTAFQSFTDGKWAEVLKIDTSTAKHFDTYSPASHGGRSEAQQQPRLLTGIGGVPGGTGNVTYSVYLDDTLAFRHVVESPIYRDPAIINYTGLVTQVVEATVSGDGELPGDGIYIGRGVKWLVRAARATTATTGHLSGALLVQ